MQALESIQLAVHWVMLSAVFIYASITFVTVKKSNEVFEGTKRSVKEMAGATMILSALALVSYGSMLMKLAV